MDTRVIGVALIVLITVFQATEVLPKRLLREVCAERRFRRICQICCGVRLWHLGSSGTIMSASCVRISEQMVQGQRGSDDERFNVEGSKTMRLTEYQNNDHEHGGEEHALDIDLVEDFVPGEERRLSAVEHDAETTKNHAKRENRESPLRADMGGYASWRSRAYALRDLVGRQRDEGDASVRSLPGLTEAILSKN